MKRNSDMKTKYNWLQQTLIASLVGMTSVAFSAPPTQQGGWNGTTGYVLATTGTDKVYTCDYTAVVTYTDGTTHTQSGTTQPATGGTNLRVVEIGGNKTVSNVVVTKWVCR